MISTASKQFFFRILARLFKKINKKSVMKNVIFSALIIASAILTGCNKGGGSFTDARVKKVSSQRGFTEYTYTPENKIKSVKSSDGSTTTYTYKDKTISQLRADSVHGMFITSSIFLNAAGLADSSVASDPSGTYVELYAHDANGNISQTKDVISGHLYNASNSDFKDGNEISRIITDSTSKPRVSLFFDYYADKVNSAGYQNMGMQFLGNDSKNLMKKFVQVLPSGDTIRVMSFNYHYDEKGRVSQKAVYDNHGMLADSTSYSYY
jgi:YD repeat-containing protein